MQSVIVNGITLLNLTSHDVNILTPSGEVTVPPSGTVARIKTDRVIVGWLGGVIPVTKPTYGQPEGLPEAVENTVYIVSGQFLAALNGSRPDVYSPGELARNDKGQPVGCHGVSIGG